MVVECIGVFIYFSEGQSRVSSSVIEDYGVSAGIIVYEHLSDGE